MKSRNLPDEAATVSYGQHLVMAIDGGAVVYLIGDLGAGKTTFCRGVLRALGYLGAVKSPTYTLVEPYHLDQKTVYHFDFYRLQDPQELDYMGIRDYFQPQNLCLIEWPTRGLGYIPAPDLEIQFEYADGGRSVECIAMTDCGKKILSALE